ncbi:SMP-30/gluconolactonase/LRE family protein [Colwellia sp. C1TZA3]|uniref:SMP-30/gluconolactonase/LRE family protein n=1 Tax=Colwellia sp. C1TZA3 TaxID=2508879 RepID=UPI0011B963AA|nr:SMP-30/gluconolactonase/LRE family protein [Colwellia sp. C1TZA3]TWX72456.1 SMP-30/gluconolactonase/LRE family protein [Colwellia sp. C1TZA3]
MINKTVTAQLIQIIPCQCQLGESVLWHVEQQAIYWLDIEKCNLYRFFIVNQAVEKFALPQRMGSFSFTKNDNQIIAAFEQGIARYDLNTSQLIWLTQPEYHVVGNRFNDGKTDRQGRFWAGTMVESATISTQSAALYCIDHQLDCHKKITNLQISNGLCWNKTGDILYHSDSLTHEIFQYDFCKYTAKITNKRLFARTDASAFPDGSTIDAQGYLWNAQWGSSKVVRYNDDGEIDFSITLPVSQPSCVALGGPNLDWLIITSAKQGLSQHDLTQKPLSGDVFIYQLQGVTGLVEPKCTI